MARTEFHHTRAVRAAVVAACTLATLGGAPLALARGGGGVRDGAAIAPQQATSYSVGLEQCLTSTVQAERSVTFTAQMVATETTQRMMVEIELQQRLHGETEYHTIPAPGLGVWRAAEPGVKIDKYVQQVTDLAAPASYRALVRFHWLGEHGRVVKRAELLTPRCLQPTLPGQATQTPPATSPA